MYLSFYILLVLMAFSLLNSSCFLVSDLLSVPQEVMVPMRDGSKLYTRIWRPAQEGRYPVVFTRGYGPGSPQDAQRFNQAG